MIMSSHIFRDCDNLYWFWDEIGFYSYGPYLSENQAEFRFLLYCWDLKYGPAEIMKLIQGD